MKNKTTDPRARYTQNMVKTQLLSIIKQKPLKNVTVAEICLAAGITRGTFYNHFYDVFDVYESIEAEFVDEILNRLSSIKAYALDYSFYKEIFAFIAVNCDFARTVVDNLGESGLFKQIVAFVRKKYVSEFSEHYPFMDKERIGDTFTYILNGSIGILVEWIQQEMPLSPERMAEKIESFNRVVITNSLRTED